MAATPRLTQRTQILASLLALMALAVAIRLPGIGRPLVGNFATKNAVYAMIARNWASGASTAVHPMLDVLRGGQPSLHMVEFPVSAYLSGWAWRACGGSLEVWGRLSSVAAIAAATALMFLLVNGWHGTRAAWGASLMLALSPVSIIYGQSFMLEASVVFLALAAMYCLNRWATACDGTTSAGIRRSTGRWSWLALAATAWGLLQLTKIYMLVLLPPLVFIASGGLDGRPPLPIKNQRSRVLLVVCVLFLASLPALCWYAYAYRSGMPGGPLAERLFYSVRHSAGVHHWPHPILRSAEFYRKALDDLAGVTLTPVGLMLALLGLLHAKWRKHAAWLGCMALLAAALPLKFHEMNYYYLVVLPPLCVLAGLGWHVISSRLQPGRLAVAGLLAVALAFSLRYAARPAFVTPREDRSVVAAAQAVRELSSPDDVVVTMHGSTIDLLYYCGRRGWAVAPRRSDLAGTLADCRRHGARLLVIAGTEHLDRKSPVGRLLGRMPVVRSGKGFAVLQLAGETGLAQAGPAPRN